MSAFGLNLPFVPPFDTNAPHTYGRAQGSALYTLTDAATIATDASLSNAFLVTIGATRILGNPTNLVPGFSYTWIVAQSGVGGWNLTYGSFFKWTAATAPTLTGSTSAYDVITGIAVTASILVCSRVLDLR